VIQITRAAPLAEALAAEHAAIFAYGVVGARLVDAGDAGDADRAREADAAHRQRRDALVVVLDQRSVAPPVPAAAYELPFPVDDAGDARRLAVLVEERVAVVWRAALVVVTRDDRELVLDALVDTAVWATRWRIAAGDQPATVPFPGAPD
jgi:hypothetical protein